MVYQQENFRIFLTLKINILYIFLQLIQNELKGKNSIRYFGAVIWNVLVLLVLRQLHLLTLLRIESNLGNRIVLVDFVKPIYKV